MSPSDPSPTPFDEFLDRFLRGEKLDPTRFLEAHPELGADERRQVLTLTGATVDESEDRGSPDPMPESPPVGRLGEFRLIRRIGVGSTGAVYLAEEETLGRTVAVKLLGPDILGTGERTERFQREAKAVARLRHPNIVTVYAAGEEGGLRYIAMEYIPGSGLHELLVAATARGALPPVRDVLRWGVDIARALECAHGAGIAHRDVKPSNVRIAEDGRAVLLDFGIARQAGASTLTESGAFRGSPQYASPEQVGLQGVPVDERTDIYSLGVTLYELLTGSAPFRGETREQLFHQILGREPVPPRRIEPAVPRDLETVVLSTLEKDPRRRPASAKAVAEDLQAVIESRPVSVRPISIAGRLWRWTRRQPAKASLAFLVAVGVPIVAALGGFIVANLPKIGAAEARDLALRVDGLVEQGFLHLGEGEARNSARCFEEALQADPNSVDARAGLVQASIKLDDFARALSLLDEPFVQPSGDAWPQRLRSQVLRALGKAGEADAIDRCLGDPSSPTDHFLAGMAWMRAACAGHKDSAAAVFRELREAVLGSPVPKAIYYYELGHAAWHAGRDEEAREIARAIARLWPESGGRSFAIGRTLSKADRNASVAAFRAAVRSGPLAMLAGGFLADMLIEDRQFDEVIALSRENLAHDPGHSMSHRKLGIALSEQGKLEEARGELEESVRLDPGNGFARDKLAVLYMRLGNLEAAERESREAVRTAPDNFAARTNLGIVLLERRQVDAAIAVLKEAVRLFPDEAKAHINLSRALRKKGSLDAAVASAREGVRLAHDIYSAHSNLGNALRAAGDSTGAVASFREALRRKPDDAESACNLGLALVDLGDFEEGLAQIRAGDERGSREPKWGYPSKSWITDVERLIKLERRLGEMRRGGGAMPAPDERVLIAKDVCRRKRWFAEAARLYATAFAESPDLLVERRVDAAVAAASAAMGTATDSPTDDIGRTALREQARAWLEEELSRWERSVESGDANAGEARGALGRWPKEPALVRLREVTAASRPVVPNREAWLALWAKLDTHLASGQNK